MRDDIADDSVVEGCYYVVFCKPLAVVCINYSGKLAGVLVYFTFTFNLRLMVLWSALELPTCLMSKMFDAKRT